MDLAPDYLTPTDRAILRFFLAYDIRIKPSSLAANIKYGRKSTENRCRWLASHSVLEREDGPLYRLSDAGREYAEELSEDGLLQG